MEDWRGCYLGAERSTPLVSRFDTKSFADVLKANSARDAEKRGSVVDTLVEIIIIVAEGKLCHENTFLKVKTTLKWIDSCGALEWRISSIWEDEFSYLQVLVGDISTKTECENGREVQDCDDRGSRLPDGGKESEFQQVRTTEGLFDQVSNFEPVDKITKAVGESHDFLFSCRSVPDPSDLGLEKSQACDARGLLSETSPYFTGILCSSCVLESQDEQPSLTRSDLEKSHSRELVTKYANPQLTRDKGLTCTYPAACLDGEDLTLVELRVIKLGKKSKTTPSSFIKEAETKLKGPKHTIGQEKSPVNTTSARRRLLLCHRYKFECDISRDRLMATGESIQSGIVGCEAYEYSHIRDPIPTFENGVDRVTNTSENRELQDRLHCELVREFGQSDLIIKLANEYFRSELNVPDISETCPAHDQLFSGNQSACANDWRPNSVADMVGPLAEKISDIVLGHGLIAVR